MRRVANDMFHDETMHEGMRRLAFLVGLAMAIVVLHQVVYRLIL